MTRLPYTPEYRQTEAMVRAWMAEAGLDVRADAVGNLIGRREGKRADQPCLMLASHIDSVINGGRFDGPLGVLSAIEVAHALSEDGVPLDRSLEVVVFVRCREGISHAPEEYVTSDNVLLGAQVMYQAARQLGG